MAGWGVPVVFAILMLFLMFSDVSQFRTNSLIGMYTYTEPFLWLTLIGLLEGRAELACKRIPDPISEGRDRMTLPISEVEIFEAFLDNTIMVSLAHQTQSENLRK